MLFDNCPVGGNRNRDGLTYHVIDRAGVSVAFFLDRAAAEYVVESVNRT